MAEQNHQDQPEQSPSECPQDKSEILAYDDTHCRFLSAIFGPITATKEEYEALFQKMGFGDYTDINIRDKYGFVRFASQAKVDLFIESINGYVFNGQKMRSSRSRPQPPTGKTLHLSGFNPNLLSERSIYNELSPYGFIRRITGKRDFAFVEFDTHEDALNVMNTFKKKHYEWEISGCFVKMAFARNEHRIDTQNLSIPLSAILPENHKFWYHVQKILSDH
ncbi:serine/arginine-rich splicing factor RS31-like isoform X2 [Histomonas meleagridis]|uniref:serine/arginine-rich splicing factor RS31-like isoform X2 n=1 Tax=Histomonas meleagridis TaxID=135588 RepID=UPI00355A2E99|nr:serine/arginine-rich splicing factor RS31-like isoform X2 [Histomonas meleagridis]KAH0805856.1 serine/arginine-rich splicing factor RS31-like isoform X2 [Histomonas meleagridis]